MNQRSIQNPVKKCPVLLVHGWKSSPAVWKDLIPKLQSEGIEYWSFDYSRKVFNDPRDISATLFEFITEKLEKYRASESECESEFESKSKSESRGTVEFDIISHSMGSCFARYLLEVLDTEKRLNVRQFIGIGAPNKPSSMAELFFDPILSEEVIKHLAGIFVPVNYNPAEDSLTKSISFGGSVISHLSDQSQRSDLNYRFILSMNRGQNKKFFSIYDGKTWVYENYELEKAPIQTYEGDGVIPFSESYLKGAGYDLLPYDANLFEEKPYMYNHIYLPRNPETIGLIMDYLKDPELRSRYYFS